MAPRLTGWLLQVSPISDGASHASLGAASVPSNSFLPWRGPGHGNPQGVGTHWRSQSHCEKPATWPDLKTLGYFGCAIEPFFLKQSTLKMRKLGDSAWPVHSWSRRLLESPLFLSRLHEGFKGSNVQDKVRTKNGTPGPLPSKRLQFALTNRESLIITEWPGLKL